MLCCLVFLFWETIMKRSFRLQLVLLVGILSLSWQNVADAFGVVQQRLHARPPITTRFLSDVNGGGELIKQSETKSELLNAFVNLQTSDQYDAVLVGLCAKLLDNSPDVSMADIHKLLQEMNASNIPLSPRSVMSTIDAAVPLQDSNVMRDTVRLLQSNKNGLLQFGNQQATVRLIVPQNANSRVQLPNNSYKTVSERLDSLTYPTDNRGQEVQAALVVGGVAVLCEAIQLLQIYDLQLPASVILWSLIGVLVVDNFYDLIQKVSNFALRDKEMKLPTLDSLPFGLGTGQATGQVVRGMSRLINTDRERSSLCEAAGLCAAYTLGLPVFAFRPNALEASVLLLESNNNSAVESLYNESGLLKVLIWLLAPVVAEQAKFPQLIHSNPREAVGCLERLEEYGGDIDKSFWRDRQEPLLKWAYAEADILVRSNQKEITEMANRLSGGAATIGDCIAVLEQW